MRCGGEGQRLALRGGHLRGRGMTLGIGDAQARRIGLDLVELARVVDDGRVAARAHVGDDLGDDAVDILVGVAIAAEEGRELLLETRRRGVEPERPDALGVPSGTTHLAEAVDPAADPLGLRLERGAVDDEARGDVGDVLDLDQPVVAQRAAAVDQVDDAVAEAERGRQLHRARELDAFGLHAARGEVAARHLGILGGDAHVAPAPRIVAARHLGGLGDGQPALADAEVDRRVDLGIVELHQHVGAGDAEVRRAERHEGRDVERAHADDVEIGMVGREAQQARIGVGEGRLRLDVGRRQKRRGLLQDPALGQRPGSAFRWLRSTRQSSKTRTPAPGPGVNLTGWAGFHGVGQGSPTSPKWHASRSISSRMARPGGEAQHHRTGRRPGPPPAVPAPGRAPGGGSCDGGPPVTSLKTKAEWVRQ